MFKAHYYVKKDKNYCPGLLLRSTLVAMAHLYISISIQQAKFIKCHTEPRRSTTLLRILPKLNQDKLPSFFKEVSKSK